MIGLLGSLEVTIDGLGVIVPRGKLRIVLAELALQAGRGLQADRLAERTWGLDLPRRPKSSVQNVVLRLRRILGADLIRTEGTRYALAVDPDDVDVLRFGRLLAEAASAAGDSEVSLTRDLLMRATALWRGEPFSDVGSQELQNDQAPVLTERYLAAVEQRMDIDLADRPASDLVPELRQLTSRFPLRESLWERMLTALYRAGRQAEALDAYERLRRSLADSLGADPSLPLQRLHQTILAQAPGPFFAALSATEEGGDSGAAAVPAAYVPEWEEADATAPAQLPFDTADFVGRAGEVTAVADWLTASHDRGLAVYTISGPGGMGKTTLAVHVAHRIAEQYPDGHLFARLIDADGEPRLPRDVLAIFLRSLGVGAAQVPESLEERVGLFRSRLQGRRLLVVLDDAVTEEQLRPLLPGTPESSALVTSRTRLVGIPGAQHLGLDALDEPQALTLLAAASGREQQTEQCPDAQRVVRACGYLPLAIRIAGSRLAARPHWPMRRFADRLADERNRLDELAQGDQEVRANLALSYRVLDDTARRAFRLLGMLDAPGFPGWVFPAVLNDPETGGEEGLERLVEAHLLQIDGYDTSGRLRCHFHELVRLYAREQALEQDSEQERRAAVVRVLEGYRVSAERAAARIPRPFPARFPISGAGSAESPWGEDPDDPYAWFDSEQSSLIALTDQACDLGLVEDAAGLASALAGFLDARGYFDEWRRIHERALDIATRSGHTVATALLLCNLGEVHLIQDRIDDAMACFTECLRLAEQVSERTLQALALANLGYLARLRAQYEQATVAYDRALSLAVEIGDKRIQAPATQGLGNIAYDGGESETAEKLFGEALRLSRESGFVVCAVRALRGLGFVARDRGEIDHAIGYVREALGELGDHPTTLGEAHTWADLADLYVFDGQYEAARTVYEANLRHFDEHGDRFGYATTCHGLGELLARIGEWEAARAHLTEAVRVFDELRLPRWRARSADALACAE